MAEIPSILSANLPIFSVDRLGIGGKGITRYIDLTAINVQIPTGLQAESPEEMIPRHLLVTVFENGVKRYRAEFIVVPFRAHVVDTCDTVNRTGGACISMATHANGTLVTHDRPATAGEEVVVYALGLGPTNPVVPTGSAPASPVPVENPERFSVHFSVTNLGPSIEEGRPFFTGLTPGYVGLYQVNLRLPDRFPGVTRSCEGEGDANFDIRIGYDAFATGQPALSDPARICVRPEP